MTEAQRVIESISVDGNTQTDLMNKVFRSYKKFGDSLKKKDRSEMKNHRQMMVANLKRLEGMV